MSNIKFTEEDMQHLENALTALTAERNALKDEVARLREALANYGSHKLDCHLNFKHLSLTKTCTCGFSALTPDQGGGV